MLWPGYFGYALWSRAAFGDQWSLDNVGAAMANGAFDYWGSLTDIRLIWVAWHLAPAYCFLRGAWLLRRVRKADKAALAEHRMRILNKNQGDDYVGK